MNFFDKLRTQKLLSFTLILFTLSVGIVIGTLINSGVKAAKDQPTVAPGATMPLARRASCTAVRAESRLSAIGTTSGTTPQ